MDATLAAFLDMDWDERIVLLRGMHQPERITFLKSVIDTAERQSRAVKNDEMEDLTEFVGLMRLALP